eukprot:814307-Pelagomonas_calceolata.AAC.1
MMHTFAVGTLRLDLAALAGWKGLLCARTCWSVAALCMSPPESAPFTPFTRCVHNECAWPLVLPHSFCYFKLVLNLPEKHSPLATAEGRKRMVNLTFQRNAAIENG